MFEGRYTLWVFRLKNAMNASVTPKRPPNTSEIEPYAVSIPTDCAKNVDSYHHLSNQLQNRVEKAADFAEDNCEELARNTQDHLENNLEQARDAVRKETERRMETLREVRQQFNELEAAQKSAQSGSYTFLAQSVGIDTAYGSISLVFGGLFGVTLAFMAFFKRNTHSVYLPSNMLG
jgi:hypothetical protein